MSAKSKENTFEVEKILQMRVFKNRERRFKIHWKGYGSHHDTWEVESNLDCPDLLKAFLEKYENDRKKKPEPKKKPQKKVKPGRRSERIFLKK